MVLHQIFNTGPYFFKTITLAESQTCSINAQRYRDMLSSFVQQRQILDKIVFMQDGAPPHVGTSVQQLLRHHFTGERVIIHCFRVPCPPRSTDLTPSDFLSMGLFKMKSLSYRSLEDKE